MTLGRPKFARVDGFFTLAFWTVSDLLGAECEGSQGIIGVTWFSRVGKGSYVYNNNNSPGEANL